MEPTSGARLTTRQQTVLILSLMATGIGQSLVFAILAPLGREVQLSEPQITSIIAVSALIFGLASPYWGRYSDRVGRKPVIITGLVGYALGTLLFTSTFYAGMAGLLTGTVFYITVLATRVCQALIMSATSPAATAYAADHSSPEMRTKTMARLGTANSLGTILGPAVSGVLVVFGLLAPLYFAAALAVFAAWFVWKHLPATPLDQLRERKTSVRLRYRDPRISLFLFAAVGLFIGFSGIQQTLGFQLQDKMHLSGVKTAQLTGAALMVSATFTLLIQVTVMQRIQLKPTQFIRLGLSSLLIGAGFISVFETFAVLAVGMAFMGTGMALCMPAISAGASLAVESNEQGAAAGLVSACPAIGFSAGPLVAGFLYQYNDAYAPVFSALVFFCVLVFVIVRAGKIPGG
ncbi:MAG: MFS transporter [Gammaproteobacteria bacterium]|jgi:MFS family permease|nr:MFS transporter [Gammaproteobacteria bacterium]